MTLVNSEWRRGKLDELGVEFVDGDRSARYPKRTEFVEQGVPFLNAESISSGRLDASKAKHLSPQKFDS